MTAKSKIEEDFQMNQGEKIVTLLRRTGLLLRGYEELNSDKDDKTLVRYIYDTFYIFITDEIDYGMLTMLLYNAIIKDTNKYGSEYKEFYESPIKEMLFVLEEIESNHIFSERYNQFIQSTICDNDNVEWEIAYAYFCKMCLRIFDNLLMWYD